MRKAKNLLLHFLLMSLTHDTKGKNTPAAIRTVEFVDEHFCV